MSLHQDAVSVLSAWQAPDRSQDELRRRYVDHLRAHHDGLTRDCVPDHLTASVLVFSADHSQVLLTLHKRIGRWLQTGGHCEPEDDRLADAALREGREETGIDDLRIDHIPVKLSHHEVPCGPMRPAHHLDVQYVAVAAPGAVAAMSDESCDLRWFDLEELPAQSDQSVRALVRVCRDRLESVGVRLG